MCWKRLVAVLLCFSPVILVLLAGWTGRSVIVAFGFSVLMAGAVMMSWPLAPGEVDDEWS